jgi:hypothetical protein
MLKKTLFGIYSASFLALAITTLALSEFAHGQAAKPEAVINGVQSVTFTSKGNGSSNLCFKIGSVLNAGENLTDNMMALVGDSFDVCKDVRDDDIRSIKSQLTTMPGFLMNDKFLGTAFTRANGSWADFDVTRLKAAVQAVSRQCSYLGTYTQRATDAQREIERLSARMKELQRQLTDQDVTLAGSCKSRGEPESSPRPGDKYLPKDRREPSRRHGASPHENLPARDGAPTE